MTKRRSNLPYLVTAVAVLVLLVTAFSAREWVAERSVRPGSVAPDFQASTLDGEPASLADFENQVVLLNIWATWCPPCREEMPSMERLYQQLRDEPFEIVAVSVDAASGEVDAQGTAGGNVRAFADSLSLTFPILHDPSGRIQQIYQTSGVPESFIIGRDRIIYRRMIGATEWDRQEYVDMIRQLAETEPE